MAAEVPIRQGLFTWPASPQDVRLIGSRCSQCGEITFPQQEFCPQCCTRTAEPVPLSRRGWLYSYTIVHHQTPGYQGPAPYGIGLVELPEGLRVLAPIALVDSQPLHAGMELELTLEALFDDEGGNRVMAYKFRPV